MAITVTRGKGGTIIRITGDESERVMRELNAIESTDGLIGGGALDSLLTALHTSPDAGGITVEAQARTSPRKPKSRSHVLR